MKGAKRFFCIFLLLFVAVFSAFPEMDQHLLLAQSIYSGTAEELQSIAKANGLPVSGDIGTLRNTLYDFYGLNVQNMQLGDPQKEGAQKGDDSKFIIKNAKNIVRNGDLIELSGDVEVEFESDNTKRKLFALNLILDTKNSYLMASGEITIDDDGKKSQLQHMEGAILTMRWKTGDFHVKNGVALAERKDKDGNANTYYFSGDNVSYESDTGEVVFVDGTIATDPVDPYWSINPTTMIMEPTGDVFLTGATIKLGRVPVFWVPFFFAPGKTMAFNPAFGFESARGAFLNTTFELYGNYPKLGKTGDTSSFTQLFSTGSTGAVYRNGIIYDINQIEPDGITKWARETDSYMSIIADFYSKRGVFVGVDTSDNFMNKKLNISLMGGLGYYPQQEPSSLSTSNIPQFRYAMQAAVTLDTDYVDLKFNAPLYSDPKAMHDYWNRFTGFSFDLLFSDPGTPPGGYEETISDPIITLTGSMSLPKLASPYISNASISNLKTSFDMKWTAPDTADDSMYYSYQINSMTLPSFNASVEGTLVEVTTEGKSAVQQRKENTLYQQLSDELTLKRDEIEKKKELEELAAEGGEKADEALENSKDLKASGEDAAYEAKADITASQVSSPSSFRLSYKLGEDFSNVINSNSKSTVYSYSTGSFTAEGTASEKFFKYSVIATPSYKYQLDQENSNKSTNTFKVEGAVSLKVPIVGLTYNINGRAYQSVKTTTGDETEEVISKPGWNKETISTHSVNLSYKFGTVTAGATAELPPLNAKLTPLVSIATGPFSASAYYTISKLNEDAAFKSEVARMNVAYSSNISKVTLDAEYQFKDLTSTSQALDPLKVTQTTNISLFDNHLVFGTNFDFRGLSADGVRNYFKTAEVFAKYDYASLSFNMDGAIDQLKPKTLKAKVGFEELVFGVWKNRIGFLFTATADFSYDFQDKYSSSLKTKFGFGFDIKEFMKITFNLVSANTGFWRYFNSDGSFQFSLMWEDFLRSFDLAGTGRYNTSFNMDAVEVEFIHYMKDWDFHCKYTGSVILSGNEWTWSPKLTIYLAWKAMPEININEKWTQKNGTWERTTEE